MPQRKRPRPFENQAAQTVDVSPPPIVVPLSRRLRVAISAFVAFNLFAIITWCVPWDSPLIARCRELSRPYLIWTGLFQKWDMFAPEPSKLNNYVAAMVTYRDGETAQWTFPRMEQLGYADKYWNERYRKYANDNLRLDANARLWPDAARYIARVNNRASNPPAVVELVRHWSIVPSPTSDRREQPAPWHQYTFFRYKVAQGDLR